MVHILLQFKSQHTLQLVGTPQPLKLLVNMEMIRRVNDPDGGLRWKIHQKARVLPGLVQVQLQSVTMRGVCKYRCPLVLRLALHLSLHVVIPTGSLTITKQPLLLSILRQLPRTLRPTSSTSAWSSETSSWSVTLRTTSLSLPSSGRWWPG